MKLNRSIDRGLTVLEVIQASGASSLAFLSVRTGLPKPTLLRICATLERRRWLSRRSSDGCFQLGSAFPNGGGLPDLADRLVAAGKVEMVRLSQKTGLAVDLAALIATGRTEIVDTTRKFGEHGVYPDAVGFRPSPILSALGSAVLAALPRAKRAETLRALGEMSSREDAGALRKVPEILRAIDEKGYAVRAPDHWGRAVDYGALPGAIAVPILAAGEPVGAINLVWTVSDRSEEDVAKAHLAELQHSADVIGEKYAAIAV
jgi:IclR family mhp operon transcriptional activator